MDKGMRSSQCESLQGDNSAFSSAIVNKSKMMDVNLLLLCVSVVVRTAVMFGEGGISPEG